MKQDIFFEKIGDKNVFSIFSKPETPQKKLVIMSHGFRGSSPGPARQFVDFQKILNNDGISVLRFDQPNSGNSEGEYVNSSFNEWIDTIVHFAKKYLNQEYEVALLGQSMGATAAVAASNSPVIKNKIPCLLLWVPDPKSNVNLDADKVFEEAGQKYKGKFWIEARESNFFQSLNEFSGKIHLVFGQTDRYVNRELREKTIQIVRDKGQEVIILNGQDHSPWEYDSIQTVFQKELKMLETSFSQ